MILTMPAFWALLIIFFQIFLGLYVFYKNRKASGLFFASFSLVLALWTFGAYRLNYSLSTHDVEFWGRFIFLGPIFIAYFFLCFSFVFPAGKLAGFLRFLLLVPSLIFVLILPTNLILRKGELLPTGPLADWGEAYYLFFVYFITYFVFGVVNFIVKYKKGSNKEKKQIKYIFTGLFLAFVFGIVFNLFLPTLGIGRYLFLGPSFTLLIIGFTAYAIVKTRLMDISVVISRTVAEVLTVVVYTAGYLALVWLYLHYFSASIKPLFLIGSMVYGYLVVQTHQPFRLFFQTSADKLFLHGKYNYYRALSDASSRVGEKLSLPEILKVLYETFYDVVEIKNPRVYLPESFTEIEKSSTCYLPYDKTTAQPLPKGVPIPLKGELVSRLIASRQPVYEVKELEAEIIVPCLLEDRLIAIFVLGPKLSEDRYTEEDLRLLEILANQVAIALDHTRSYEKIKLELEATERQLERSQRLASIGTLTAGVTHEIRNPLTVIRAETERLPNQPRDQQYLKEHSQLVLRHIDRIVGIVQRMLSLAKEKPKQQKAVNLKDLLEMTIPLFTFGQVKLVKELQPVPPIEGDSEELQEVVVNLIQNALEAMPQGGTLTLKTYEQHGKVVLEVSDTGKGIPEELREKIFDPFFSTRHEGTGLGLSIVYRIVREHNGDISVESGVGSGSTFRVVF